MAAGCHLTVEDPPLTAEDTWLAGDLFRHFYGKTALIFANSRSKIEFYADLVGRQAERQRLPNRFRVHHGSLSKAEREDTEAALRSDVPTATFCSSTLEMGIDVGNVTEVGQIGAPWSVSSVAQRLGRSGRREDDPSVLRMYIEEDEATAKSPLIQRLYPQLLQGVATTELMLTGWCEPPEADRLHVSTLVQQILSVITERGGARADQLFDLLVATGAFTNVDQRLFVGVLRSMGTADLLDQTPEGELILGLRGEKIVRSYDFYAAFLADVELRVLHGGRLIGTVTALPGLGADGYIILAGRRWRVVEIDDQKGEILVEPSRGGRVPHFAGMGGADIHPQVRSGMRDLLTSELMPAYLDTTAQQMLTTARCVVRETGVASTPFFRDGSTVYWFTWSGSRVNQTLMALGRFCAHLDVRGEDVALAFTDTPEEEIRGGYLHALAAPPTTHELATEFPSMAREKYDGFLTQTCRRWSSAATI